MNLQKIYVTEWLANLFSEKMQAIHEGLTALQDDYISRDVD